MKRERLPSKKTTNAEMYQEVMSSVKPVDIESDQVVSSKIATPKSDVVELLEEIRDLLKILIRLSTAE